MTKYNDIIKETGFLTTEGDKLVEEQFIPALQTLLSYAQTENEMRVLGGILSNIVGKTVSNLMQEQHLKETINHIVDPFDNFDYDPSNILKSRADLLDGLISNYNKGKK